MAWEAPHLLGGPVLDREFARNSRNSWCRLARTIYLAWLAFQFLIVYASLEAINRLEPGVLPGQQPFHVGLAMNNRAADYVLDQFHQQVWLILLLAPAIVIGSLSREKEQNTLLALLGTELTSTEIVIGKLLGRSAVLADPIIASAPILAVVGAGAGIPWPRLIALICQVMIILLAASGIALLVAVWTRRTSDALLGCYSTLFIGYFALENLLSRVHMPNVLDPFSIQEQMLNGWNRLDPATLLGHLATWMGIGVVCLWLASWRLRPVAIKHLDYQPSRRLWAFRAPIGDSPVEWRERQVIGVAPVTILRQLPRNMARLGVFAFALLVAATALDPTGGRRLLNMLRRTDRSDLRSLIQNVESDRIMMEVSVMGVVLLVGCSAVSLIRGSQTIPEEMRRKTWDDLIVTPLSLAEIARGKRRGISQAIGIYACVYAIPMLALSTLGGWAAMIVALAFVGASVMASVGLSWIGIDMAYTRLEMEREALRRRPTPIAAPPPSDAANAGSTTPECPSPDLKVSPSGPSPVQARKRKAWSAAAVLGLFQVAGVVLAIGSHLLDTSLSTSSERYYSSTREGNIFLAACAGIIDGSLVGAILLILRVASAHATSTRATNKDVCRDRREIRLNQTKMAVTIIVLLLAIFMRWSLYPTGPSWINYYKSRSGMNYAEAAEQLGGLGEYGLLWSVGTLNADGSWTYEDDHLKLYLGSNLEDPATVTIESRGGWNHLTGPILELLGF